MNSRPKWNILFIFQSIFFYFFQPDNFVFSGILIWVIKQNDTIEHYSSFNFCASNAFTKYLNKLFSPAIGFIFKKMSHLMTCVYRFLHKKCDCIIPFPYCTLSVLPSPLSRRFASIRSQISLQRIANNF